MNLSAFRSILLALLMTTTLSACEFLSRTSKPPADDSPVVARVYDRYLYRRDIADLVKNADPEDSASIVNRFVESWVRRQLLTLHAERNANINETALERQVQEYRSQLIIFEYQRRLVEEKLDTAVSEQEIISYYEANQQSFELKQNIVKGLFVTAPKDSPRLSELKKLMNSGHPDDRVKLKDVAYSYAIYSHLNDSIWLDFEELILTTPFNTELSNKILALKSNRFLESTDSAYHYLFKINDYKIISQTSPLEFVRKQIRDIIINKRKIELIQQYENDIFNKAARNKDYEVLNRQ